MAVKVGLKHLGCRVNKAELDGIERDLFISGLEIVPQDEADIIVINTCAVTGEAEAKARHAVRQALSFNNVKHVIATGCAVSLFSDEFTLLDSRVVVEPLKSQVVSTIKKLCNISNTLNEDPKLHHLPSLRPSIKIQDGCNNRCTYCIVWKARGKSSSLKVDEVLKQVQQLSDLGAYEVVLCGINVGTYNSDNLNLAGLIERILTETDIDRLRISSIEPQDVSPELLTTMQNAGGRVAPFLHIPLQSGSDKILKSMGRLYDTKYYANVVSLARDYLEMPAIACDVIVGFPLEDDETFEESYEFCKKMHFAKMHVFRYSARPGTIAAEMTEQVPPEIKAERARKMIELSNNMRQEFAEKVTAGPLLVESPGIATNPQLLQVHVDKDIPVGTVIQANKVQE